VLLDVVKRRNIEFKPLTELVEVRADAREAVFKVGAPGPEQKEEVIKYDLLHAVPVCVFILLQLFSFFFFFFLFSYFFFCFFFYFSR
jgi:hypothetical protein